MGGCCNITERIVEAYIGEYASGKSENAINRSLELVAAGRQVTIVDLDTVEPFYTLRPLKRKLEQEGLRVIAWDPSETMGLGETGSLIRQDMIWALQNQGDIIMDVGYGVHGAKIFNLIEGATDDSNLQVIAVVNASRPMTGSIDDIVNYIKSLGRVDALVNNTHLGDETTPDVIEAGASVVKEAAEILGLPLLYTAVARELENCYTGGRDSLGNPVKFLRRWMTEAFW